MLFLRGLLVFICFFVIACSGDNFTIDENMPFCTEHTLDQDHCRFSVGTKSIWISSSDRVIHTEQQTRLLLWSDAPLTISNAEVRGLNMYMGRLPVIVHQVDEHTWTAEFMLGACTEPHMVWELQLRINHPSSQESAESSGQILRIPFVTSSRSG